MRGGDEVAAGWWGGRPQPRGRATTRARVLLGRGPSSRHGEEARPEARIASRGAEDTARDEDGLSVPERSDVFGRSDYTKLCASL